MEAEGKIPHNVVWGVNEHGWMKTIDMIRFQRHVYDIRPMKRSVNEPSICHADIFGPHCDQDVVNLFERMHTDLNYCAGNCTSVGSPLDVNGMHIFKARVKKEFAKWRQDQDDTPDTRQSPGMMHIMQWVSKAWDAVPPEQLQKGWKKAKLWYLSDDERQAILDSPDYERYLDSYVVLPSKEYDRFIDNPQLQQEVSVIQQVKFRYDNDFSEVDPELLPEGAMKRNKKTGVCIPKGDSFAKASKTAKVGAKTTKVAEIGDGTGIAPPRKQTGRKTYNLSAKQTKQAAKLKTKKVQYRNTANKKQQKVQAESTHVEIPNPRRQVSPSKRKPAAPFQFASRGTNPPGLLAQLQKDKEQRLQGKAGPSTQKGKKRSAAKKGTKTKEGTHHEIVILENSDENSDASELSSDSESMGALVHTKSTRRNQKRMNTMDDRALQMAIERSLMEEDAQGSVSDEETQLHASTVPSMPVEFGPRGTPWNRACRCPGQCIISTLPQPGGAGWTAKKCQWDDACTSPMHHICWSTFLGKSGLQMHWEQFGWDDSKIVCVRCIDDCRKKIKDHLQASERRR